MSNYLYVGYVMVCLCDSESTIVVEIDASNYSENDESNECVIEVDRAPYMCKGCTRFRIRQCIWSWIRVFIVE